MSIRKILIAAAVCLPVFLTSVRSYAQEMQEQEDSLVRLDYGESAELLEISDMVSDIAEIKHQYRRGIPAGKGLDF